MSIRLIAIAADGRIDTSAELSGLAAPANIETLAGESSKLHDLSTVFGAKDI
jgi:hypothetical protein